MKLIKHQGGDTIVEVLIAILIMGTVLAGAYATANRSLTNIRDSQEHQEATSLAQSQMDALGADTKTNVSPYYSSAAGTSAGKPFCYNNSGNIVTDACVNLGTEGIYNVAITANGNPDSGYLQTFKATVTWDRLGGGTDSVQLYYQPDNEN